MDTLEDYEQLYEDITELNYTAFFEDYEYEIDFDDYLLKVDVSYRVEYMRFPIGDPEMETRLDSVCENVAYEIIRKNAIHESMGSLLGEEEEEEEEEPDENDFDEIEHQKLKEQLQNNIELFTKQKGKVHKQTYPQNRMFKRKDFWLIQKIDFVNDAIDSSDAYEAAFEELVNEGYYVLKERGGDPKHDIFFIVEV